VVVVSLLPFHGQAPRVAPDAYVAPGAWLIGDVTLGPEASVWFNAVLRADQAPIVLGRRVNLQDGAIVHVDAGYPTELGEDVTVGHAAIVHAATVGPRVLVGMQAVILTGATIGEGCILGAGALIPEGRTIPPRSLVLGTPGRVVREVRDDEYAGIIASAEHYAELALAYRTER
jgi:carbonic anhydrase/acetyltransferase-like protein (isoleucine patch superfamily)